MPAPPIEWQIQSLPPPAWFVQVIEQHAGGAFPHLAQLLWQRGIQDLKQIPGFLNPQYYRAASPCEFGQEMEWAVARLQQAIASQETVAIWGDFDADGVTATAVLWEGLGQFLRHQKTLFYYIPNRLSESHGLSRQGLDLLQGKGCRLVVTCDTGSTNLKEIDYARSRGMDVIVTDHHTLPADRPPVTAIINPRYLPTDHPLATLSGVAVAYKLVEALYAALPDLPKKPLEELLDLVAIGLIADLVELRGDCRYLAQRGIQQLQKQGNTATATRPGIAKLLEFCQRSGDRPTDISFGLGPRINAVSRIQGDAHFCVELLTSRDNLLCTHLAESTELANSRRKALQKEVAEDVTRHLAQLDLSTTSVIVLADEQWQIGVLGLVAGQIAQEYGRPTILLSTEGGVLARGSARSVNNIDLYQLVQNQAHLLSRFGGHPYAAGLSLAIENLDLFTDGINQQLRQFYDPLTAMPHLTVDLNVTVAELGKALFQELKLLEPYGMGNPAPRLLLRDVWFDRIWNKNIQDRRGRKVQYIKTEFELRDDSTDQSFPGIWWGHYKDEIPTDRCDAVVELDFNAYKKRYEVRLIALRPTVSATEATPANDLSQILDWRTIATPTSTSTLRLDHCPGTWGELQAWYRRSQQEGKQLALAYPPPLRSTAPEIWQQLAGIAKYLSRTGKTATRQQLFDKLGIGDRSLQLGIRSLVYLGFHFTYPDHAFQVIWQAPQPLPSDEDLNRAIAQFFTAIQEEQFCRQYFYQVPLELVQAIASHTLPVTENHSLPMSAGP